MQTCPRISIVTPSFNQGRYIAETIDSVVGQQYPNLEHIVTDGGSTDGTLEILARYPHLQIISERDRGQADAINKGFRLATGDIWGFLNSDDTLLPGALHRVAQEIDPTHGRHIVMGRCRFTDAQGRFTGIEHPSHFESHRRVLEIWKGHTIPQPAVFWTPEVWRACGPMREEPGAAWIDYDLFCRFSRHYAFHFVDQVFATYRLHEDSKTQQSTEAARLEESIQISRRYWGSPLALMYWQLVLSLAWHRFNRTGRAYRILREAQAAWHHRQFLRAIPYAVAGGVLAPDVALYAGLYPQLRDRSHGLLRWVLDRLPARTAVAPQTAAYLDHTQLWEDGWAGPRLVVARQAGPTARTLVFAGFVPLTLLRKPFALDVHVDGQRLGKHRVEGNDEFRVELALPQPFTPGAHQLEFRANAWFVPQQLRRGDDFRPLAWRPAEIAVV